MWSGYNAFYEATIPDSVTSCTWLRLLDPGSALFGRLAIIGDEVIGFSVAVVHEGSWTAEPSCYLEDLFVDVNYRGRGYGRLLIMDIIARAKSNGWARVYWHTKHDNPARHLYDEFVQADEFVRYRVFLK